MKRITQERLPLGLTADEWRLDERTREVGRQGLAAARAALQDATRRAEAREHDMGAEAA